MTMVSLKDIAAACGVSASTVSKALNDLDDISEKRKAMIRQKANEMGYLPNMAARALKTKMTHAERKELEELEEKRRKQEVQRQKNAAFQDRVAQQKAKVDAQKGKMPEASTQSAVTSKMSIKEQMELLQQIKSLLDAGVLTPEEFEKKKQEILNS